MAAFAANRERVEAERTLRSVEAAVLGGGHGKEPDLRRAIRSLERRASDPGAGRKAATVADWQAAGVKIVEQERGTDG